MRGVLATFVVSAGLLPVMAQSSPSSHAPCRFKPTVFEGWKAQEVANEWVRLTIVPQLGGRLMQVTFAGHAYLFVNQHYKGQYLPPSRDQWFNYGGDKLWPLPEGTQDERHWPGPVSDVLDDGGYEFKVVSQGERCTVRLDGPADARTGLQYSREISLQRDSPAISFHAVMRNATGHPIEWSVQSVSQYDTASQQHLGDYNRDFWAFTPTNPHSAYFTGYQVRLGAASDPSFSVKDGMFALHWIYLENEVWVDSPAGWIAVVDGSSQYAMVERFEYDESANYPGKASVIFYKNGVSLDVDDQGRPFMSSAKPEDTPYYMEAELNSPMVELKAGEAYSFDTTWFPTRMDNHFSAVTSAGVVGRRLTVARTATGVVITGSFGVFTPGNLIVHIYDGKGVERATVPLGVVSPAEFINLHQELKVSADAVRVSIHLVDERGADSGLLGEASIEAAQGGA